MELMEYIPNDNLLIIFLSKSKKPQSQTGQPAKQRQGANQYMSKTRQKFKRPNSLMEESSKALCLRKCS